MKKPIVQYPDFQKLEMLVGEVKTAVQVEGSQKLLELSIDLGVDYGIVTILAGIRKWYKPKQLIGNKYAVVANLEPKKIFGKLSNGMLMAVDFQDKAVLLKLPKKIMIGTTIR